MDRAWFELRGCFSTDVFDSNGDFSQNKLINSYDEFKGKANNWLKDFSKASVMQDCIGNIHSNGNDFQHQNDVFIDNDTIKKNHLVDYIKKYLN